MVGESFNVRYEDNELLVVSKPAGLVVHPAAGHRGDALVDALAARRPALRRLERAGLVHRLDRDTSGLLVFGKTTSAVDALAKQFADRRVGKRYQALVYGTPGEPEGLIDAPLTRHRADRKRMAVAPGGKVAQTRYRLVRQVGPYALLDVWPSTGRTHQIRVHLAALGHPVVGDQVYGRRPDAASVRVAGTGVGPGRQFLHAAELRFRHPRTGLEVRVSDPLPADLKNWLEGVTA